MGLLNKTRLRFYWAMFFPLQQISKTIKRGSILIGSTMALQHILAAMSYMMHQRKSFVHSIMGCVIEPPLLSATEEKHHQKKEKKIIFHGLYICL